MLYQIPDGENVEELCRVIEEEAKEEFTVENGYFASYSECTKSE